MDRKTVGDAMVRRLATVPPDATLQQVRDIFAHVRFHHLLVVEKGRLVGIISDRDILRTSSPFFGTVNEQPRDAALMSRRVHQIMTRQPICATPAIPLADAVRTMYRRKISALPVIRPETGELAGLLTWKDVVRTYIPEAFRSPSESERRRHSTTTGLTGGKGDSDRGYVRAPAMSMSIPGGETAPMAAPMPTQPLPPPQAGATAPLSPSDTAFQPAPEILAVIAAAAESEAAAKRARAADEAGRS